MLTDKTAQIADVSGNGTIKLVITRATDKCKDSTTMNISVGAIPDAKFTVTKFLEEHTGLNRLMKILPNTPGILMMGTVALM